MKARMPAGYGRPDPNAMMRQVQKMQGALKDNTVSEAQILFFLLLTLHDCKTILLYNGSQFADTLPKFVLQTLHIQMILWQE